MRRNPFVGLKHFEMNILLFEKENMKKKKL